MKKMIMAIVPRDEAEFVLNALIYAGYTATYSETRGGMLRQAQVTFFSVVDEENLEEVLKVIKESCRTRVEIDENATHHPSTLGSIPVASELGGAVVFIWDVGRIETY